MHTVLGIDEERGARRMQSQIRLSALFLAAVMSIGVVAGMIVLRPPLTQMYYAQLGGLALPAHASGGAPDAVPACADTDRREPLTEAETPVRLGAAE